MNTADTFKMKMLDDRQCVAVSAAVLAADKPLLRRLGQGAFNEYANRLSLLMRESIVESDDFGNDFEDVSAEITSPMRYAHHLINDCGVAVISAQDEEQGVHMQPVKVEFNDKRLVSNIGAYCADGNLETFAARAETQVKATANELVKANAEARYKAGFDVKITRTGADRCCDWCAKRIGQWTIDNAPDGVFGCHDNCKCTVEYRNSKGVTSRRTGRVGSFVEVDYKPHVGVVQNGENQPQGLTSGANGGKTNYARIIDSMFYADDYEYQTYTKEEIIEHLKSSPVGLDTIRYLEENPQVKVKLSEDRESANRGEHYKDLLTVWLCNCPNVRVAAQTVVHEVAHHKYNIGGSQLAETICFAFEKMHKERRNYVTNKEWEKLAEIVRQAYWDFPPEGGVGDVERFKKFIKDG